MSLNASVQTSLAEASWTVPRSVVKMMPGAPQCPAQTVAVTLYLPSIQILEPVTCVPGCYPPNTGAPSAHSEGPDSFLPTQRKVNFWAQTINIPREARHVGCSHRCRRHQICEVGGP